MDKEQVKFILKNTSPFDKLTAAGLNQLLSFAQIQQYPAASFVYKEGDACDYLYLLIFGRIAIMTSHGSILQHIELIKRGTCFGIISFFTQDNHSVTAKTLESSVVVKFPKNEFNAFLAKHWRLHADLSRIFSQRVKKRTHPKTIFKSKKIFISGMASTGKTTYMLQLAAQLIKHTAKRVICLEASITGDFTVAKILKAQDKVLQLDSFDAQEVYKYINTDKVDHLLVSFDGKKSLTPLLNILAEDYHFILCEIPLSSVDSLSQDILGLESDIHFLTLNRVQSMEQSGKIIEGLIKKDKTFSNLLKPIICEFSQADICSYQEKIKILNLPVFATLLAMDHVNYQNALRRIARQIGEVVLGLALGGGGAFACSHIGALEVLEENNVSVDAIAGTSMGALVAGLWACGFDRKQISVIVADFGRAISSFSVRGFSWNFPFLGLMKSKPLEDFLKNIFANRTFQDLKMPLYVTVFDFTRRQIRIINQGYLYKVIAASCAYPGLFEPIKVGDDFFLDGGVLAPLPTAALLNCGVNKIIAVDITPSREEMKKVYESKNKFHIFDFIFGSVEAMQKEFIRQALSVADVVIHPNLAGYNWLDFNQAQVYIELGRKASQDALLDIKKLVQG